MNEISEVLASLADHANALDYAFQDIDELLNLPENTRATKREINARVLIAWGLLKCVHEQIDEALSCLE